MSFIRRLDLRNRLLIAAILPALLVAGVIGAVYIDRYAAQLHQATQDRGLAIARQLAPSVELTLFTGSTDALVRFAQSAEKADPLVRGVLFVDRQERTLVRTADLGIDTIAFTGRAQVIERDATLVLIEPVFETALLSASDAELWGASPSGAPKLLGHVVVEMSLHEVRQRTRTLIGFGAGITFLALLVAAWMSARIAATVSRPIMQMTDVVGKIGSGELNSRCSYREHDVLANLGAGINEMARRIELTNQEMQQQIDEATQQLRGERDALSYMARTDALTGLKNRRAFDEEVQMEIRRAVRHGTALTLVMADIDYFKRINDNFGHQFGDLVLAHFSRIISMSIRTIDVPGRWGGEEFVILMPDTGLEEACQVAERIRMTFEQSPLKRGGDDCVVTASFGLAQLSAKEPTLDFLLSRADTALYRAKEDGRNRLVKG